MYNLCENIQELMLTYVKLMYNLCENIQELM